MNCCSDFEPSRTSQCATRVSDAVAEYEIQSPSDLVDEVVHIGFEAAVVIAGEQNALLAVQKCPAREMDGLNSPEPAAVVDVARAIVDQP